MARPGLAMLAGMPLLLMFMASVVDLRCFTGLYTSKASRFPARAGLVSRKAGAGISYGLLMPAPGSFPQEIYDAAKRERDDLVSSLDEAKLVFEEELQEMPRASMLAHLLVQAHEVDIVICVHPTEYTPLAEEAESTALGRQFFRVRESMKATARRSNVPILMHPAVCDASFLAAMSGTAYFKDVTKATVDDAITLAEAKKATRR